MAARYVNVGGVAVELGGGGGLLGAVPPLLSDAVNTGASSRSVFTVTASGTPHTLGSWVEVDASLSADAGGVFVNPTNTTNTSTTDTSTLLAIGTGSAGNEVVWAYLGVGFSDIRRWFIPGFIAAGTRVAVAIQSAVASKSLANVVVACASAGTPVPGAPVTMGANTATSRGVTVTAPGSLNTKGAWTEIEDSTSVAFSSLLVCPQGDGDTSLANNSSILVDIGIGAAASETVLIGDIYLTGSSSELYEMRSPLLYGVSIPAGSRLSARYARANVDNSLDLTLVGTPPA